VTIPARYTDRVPCSEKNSTYKRRTATPYSAGPREVHRRSTKGQSLCVQEPSQGQATQTQTSGHQTLATLAIFSAVPGAGTRLV
jgi:hypothetical protein